MGTRRGRVAVVAAIALSGIVLATALAQASGPTPTACTAAAIRADLAAGGDYVFSCTGPVTIQPTDSGGSPAAFVVGTGTTASFDGTSSEVTIDAEGASRDFDVAAGANLTLTGVNLEGGAVTGPAGSDGEDGADGADGLNGTNGTDGVGAGAPGQTGSNAPQGVNGASQGGAGTEGMNGNDAYGGAVSNQGTLTLIDDELMSNTVTGGDGGGGGSGGAGGAGGNGGNGGNGGTATPPAKGAGGAGGSAGTGSPGGGGGSGANGGSGGDGDGGAIYNAAGATLIVEDSDFQSNSATGGDGGAGGNGAQGGDGGTGGGGGNGGSGVGNGNSGGNAGHGASSGDGGDGGDGGTGGDGGAGQGGAIYNDGGSLSIDDTQFDDNQVLGGFGGSAGGSAKGGLVNAGGAGGTGGPGGGGTPLGAGGKGGDSGAGGTGGNGGSGGGPGAGGNGLGGAVFSTNSITIDGAALSASETRRNVGPRDRSADTGSPTTFHGNATSTDGQGYTCALAGATNCQENCPIGLDGCGAPAGGPYIPSAADSTPGGDGGDGDPTGANGQPALGAQTGKAGDPGPTTTRAPLTGGTEVWIGLATTVPPSTPTCNPLSGKTTAGKPVTLKLSCSGGGGGPYTFVIVSQPQDGTLTGLNPTTGTVTYTPKKGFVGKDHFTFTAGSTSGTEAPVTTVTITVTQPTLTKLHPKPGPILGHKPFKTRISAELEANCHAAFDQAKQDAAIVQGAGIAVQLSDLTKEWILDNANVLNKLKKNGFKGLTRDEANEVIKTILHAEFGTWLKTVLKLIKDPRIRLIATGIVIGLKEVLLHELEEPNGGLNAVFDHLVILADKVVDEALDRILDYEKEIVKKCDGDPPDPEIGHVPVAEIPRPAVIDGCQLPAFNKMCHGLATGISELAQAAAGGTEVVSLLITSENRYATAATARRTADQSLQLAAIDVYEGEFARIETETNTATRRMIAGLADGPITIGVPIAPAPNPAVLTKQADTLTLGQLGQLLTALRSQLPASVAGKLTSDLKSADAAIYVQTQAAALDAFARDALRARNATGAFLAAAAPDAAG